MIASKTFIYEPGEHEMERASNSYLMSLVALIGGLPIPVINLVATLFFFLANRKSTYFVRWHCMQALFSQLSLLLLNSYGFWWTISIIFDSDKVTNNYLAFMITVVTINLVEFIATIYSAVNTRKGLHIEWYFYGTLTNMFCKP